VLRDPGIGEGKSKSLYVPPIATDTAVIMAFFNPANYKRPLKNIIYVMHTLTSQDIPCYVIECVFPHRRPQVPGASMVVHSKTPMFYKEQLFNLMEKEVPPQYTKLVFMDGDVIFEAPDWIDQVSRSLEDHDIIMPFENACWLYPDNITVRSFKKSLAWALTNEIEFHNFHQYHPGFAWAMRRDFFNKIGGFFDKKFLGGGDVSIGAVVLPGVTEEAIRASAEQASVVEPFFAYYKRVKALEPRIGYLPFDVYHLFHGLKHERKYSTRYPRVKKLLQGDFESFTKMNPDGLYEFTDPQIAAYAVEYFKGRNEDIPIDEALKEYKHIGLPFNDNTSRL
jgi:hypothetical protein